MLNIRRAQQNDVEPILLLLSPYVKKGIVLKRTQKEILQSIDHFFIAESFNNIEGVVSFYDYGTNLKEIRSLVVSDKSQKTGIGKKLVNFAVNYILKKSPEARIFTLTYLPEFFKKISFTEVDKESFPEKIWKDCIKCPKINCCDEIALEYKRGYQ